MDLSHGGVAVEEVWANPSHGRMYRPQSRGALRGLLLYWSIIVHIPSLNIAVRAWGSSWLMERRDIRNSGTKNASIHTPFNCTIPFFLACTSFVSPSLMVIFTSVIESFFEFRKVIAIVVGGSRVNGPDP